jgi:hypothetical protein
MHRFHSEKVLGRWDMNVEFDWQASDDSGKWETIVTIGNRAGPQVPGWAWGILVTALVTLVAGGRFAARWRYDLAVRHIAFQIQSVIDLEARALGQRNLDLYLAQQDKASPGWYVQQASRANLDWLQCEAGALAYGSLTRQEMPQDHCPPVPRAKLQNVELKGDVAWVEVITGQDPVRQVLFYRQTELGWKHTAPRGAFWANPVELAYDGVIVRYHKRDLPYIESLVEHIVKVVGDVCASLDCPPDSVLEVDFATEMSPNGPLALSEDTLTLASPWLSGIPIEGAWSDKDLNTVTYWVIYAKTAQFMRSTADRSLNQLQKAILDEYAILYSRAEVSQAPILRRVIERHGIESPRAVLRWLSRTQSLSTFITQWLPPLPSKENDYLRALMDIQGEAARAGRKDTAQLIIALLCLDYDRWHEYEWVEELKMGIPGTYGW